ncbi:MAG: methylmalonyl Co-A mutase-associated GTPase MeaB [Geminicoccaceae bacterium]|nr:MAG: methylmalonyl Co-A mutase-associated GTPase MeaB [Geminicoccaceae bacterium]
MTAAAQRRHQPLDALIEGVLAGERASLARAITLVESRREDHRTQARKLLEAVLPHAGKAHRIGVTGVPGVGKSTFLEAFGTMLTGQGHKVAVLAVDPSSRRTGGSILGDKTRMVALATDPNAFVRPSPSAGTLGGVARASRETILLCEAAGYDIVFVETVGVGQSETLVADMVDLFLVLMLPGAGDELQGIKKGILELADLLVVNKADGDRQRLARQAARDLSAALRILQPDVGAWTPRVLTCSSTDRTGLEKVWDAIGDHRQALEADGSFAKKRARQQVNWMWAQLEDRLLHLLKEAPTVAQALPTIEAEVQAGTRPPTVAAEDLLTLFLNK